MRTVVNQLPMGFDTVGSAKRRSEGPSSGDSPYGPDPCLNSATFCAVARLPMPIPVSAPADSMAIQKRNAPQVASAVPERVRLTRMSYAQVLQRLWPIAARQDSAQTSRFPAYGIILRPKGRHFALVKVGSRRLKRGWKTVRSGTNPNREYRGRRRLRILNKRRAAITAATENNDLSGTEQTAVDMRAGVARKSRRNTHGSRIR